jgi:hypothetical protein
MEKAQGSYLQDAVECGPMEEEEVVACKVFDVVEIRVAPYCAASHSFDPKQSAFAA